MTPVGHALATRDDRTPVSRPLLTHLERLEAESIHIMREVVNTVEMTPQQAAEYIVRQIMPLK